MVALAGQAMDEVRTSEWRSHPQAVTEVFGDKDSDTRKGLMWGMRKNSQGWTAKQAPAMMGAAALLWGAAFLLQSAHMLPVFWRPRADGASGCAGITTS